LAPSLTPISIRAGTDGDSKNFNPQKGGIGKTGMKMPGNLRGIVPSPARDGSYLSVSLTGG